MIIKDRVYGKTSIDDPILVELIRSAPLQRLKKVDQAGYYEPWFPGTAHNRYEHSLGVCILLRKYGASIEEQVAGLIHDVSHAAFSHTIDYVLDAGSEKKHSHQDRVFSNYVKKSEIPTILKKHNVELGYILNDKNFPLKENDLPDLCADRIDYALREARVYREIESADKFLNNLKVEGRRWVFSDFKTASSFARLFVKLNQKYFADFASASMFRTVGDYLRHSLTMGYISKSDLYSTDGELLSRIRPYHKKDVTLAHFFKRMNRKTSITNNPENFDVEVFCKSRVVDPLCWHNKKIKRISEVDETWLKVLKRESKPKHYFLKFVE